MHSAHAMELRLREATGHDNMGFSRSEPSGMMAKQARVAALTLCWIMFSMYACLPSHCACLLLHQLGLLAHLLRQACFTAWSVLSCCVSHLHLPLLACLPSAMIAIVQSQKQEVHPLRVSHPALAASKQKVVELQLLNTVKSSVQDLMHSKLFAALISADADRHLQAVMQISCHLFVTPRKQHSTAQHSTAQHSTAQHSIPWRAAVTR